MDLKTVVVDKLSRSGVRNYPLVFSQSLEALPSLSSAHHSHRDSDSRQSSSRQGQQQLQQQTKLLEEMNSKYAFQSSRPSTIDDHIDKLLHNSIAVGTSSDQGNANSSGNALVTSSEEQANHFITVHSPPIAKYNGKINDEDLMSFLSLRLPTTQAIDPYGEGFSSQGSPQGSIYQNIISPHGKGQLVKGGKWTSSMKGTSFHEDKEDSLDCFVLANSHSHSAARLNSDDDSGGDGALDAVDLSGPGSPASDKIRRHFNSSGTPRSALLKHSSNGPFPEIKQIVYNTKGSQDFAGKFHLFPSKVKATSTDSNSEAANMLMITSMVQKPPIVVKEVVTGGGAKEKKGNRSANDGRTNLPVIADRRSGVAKPSTTIVANSETIRSMRKDLLSR